MDKILLFINLVHILMFNKFLLHTSTIKYITPKIFVIEIRPTRATQSYSPITFLIYNLVTTTTTTTKIIVNSI